MRRSRAFALLPLAALLALAACSASAPPVRLHTLMPAELAQRDPLAGRTPLFIALEPIRVPAQVDQPQWLIRLPDESLAVLEQPDEFAEARFDRRQGTFLRGLIQSELLSSIREEVGVGKR